MINYPSKDRNVNELFIKHERKYIDMLNEILGDIEFTPSEENFLQWMTGWDDWTIKNFISVIEKVKKVK